jgi:hypothetical protein
MNELAVVDKELAVVDKGADWRRLKALVLD